MLLYVSFGEPVTAQPSAELKTPSGRSGVFRKFSTAFLFQKYTGTLPSNYGGQVSEKDRDCPPKDQLL